MTNSWYVAMPDGTRQGPLSAKAIKSAIGAGKINGETLVWAEGMEDWSEASAVPELGAAAAVGPSSPSASAPGPSSAASPVNDGDSSPASPLTGARPWLDVNGFRKVGRLCAAVAVVIAVASVAFVAFGFSWFTGSLLFGLAFLVGEGVAAVLAAIQLQQE